MLKPRPFNWLRFIRVILYTFTAIFYFLTIGEDIYGGSANVGGFILNRCLFYIAETVLLAILYVRSRKTPEQFDSEYSEKTVNIKKAVDTGFMMIIIVTLLALAEMIPVISFPRYDISGDAVNGPLAVLLLTVVMTALYFFVMGKFRRTEEKNELLKPPPPVKEEFYAFLPADDEKKEEAFDSEVDDELIPDEEDFRRNLQQISAAPQSEQLWECPFCGYLNLSDSRQCSFCGAESEQRKENNNDR